MPQHTREEVRQHIINNLEDVIDQIQLALTYPGMCEDDCKECWISNLCVEEGYVEDRSNEKVPD